MATSLETQKNYENPLKNVSSELSNLMSEIEKGSQNLETNLDPEITKKEEAEYLRLNNKYDSLLKKVSSWGDIDYRPYDDEEDLFKKQGLSFVSSIDGAWLAIRSKSNDYGWTEIVRFRSEYHKDEGYGPESNKRPCLIINSGEEIELSTAQYKKVLDQAENILKNQINILDSKRQKEKQKSDKKVDDMINNL